ISASLLQRPPPGLHRTPPPNTRDYERAHQLPPPLVLRGAGGPDRVRHCADLDRLPGLRQGRGQLRGGTLVASAIEVRNVSKHFKLYHEQYHTLKERLIFLRRAKRFEEFHALEDVSFEVEEGTTFGLIGANGSGKSTILKLMAGILRPSAGEVIVKGRIGALLEVGAGFHPDLTGRQNVYLNGSI